MSTKIYQAYRLKRGVDPFVWAVRVRRQGQAKVQGILMALYRGFMDAHPDMDEMGASNFYRKIFLEGREAPEVAVCIWKHGARYYAIPYAQEHFQNALSFLARDRNLESFAYWNNTDQPRHVSAKEWKLRGRIWDQILDLDKGEGQWDRLLLEIFSKGNFYRVDPAVKMIKALYRGLTEKEKEALQKQRDDMRDRWNQREKKSETPAAVP